MSLPLTAFEQRVAAEAQPDWCTLAEELSYLNAIVAEFPARVSYQSVGSSVLGNPLWEVIVTEAGPIPIDKRHKVMAVGLQHGDEGAGRQGILQFIRRLANDGSVTAYLQRTAWVFLVTANPDRSRVWADGHRRNANNIDINRRHFTVDQPETAALQSAIRRHQPVIVSDHHEYATGSQGCDLNRGRHTEIPIELRNDSDNLVTASRQALGAAGISNKIYDGTIPNRGNLTNPAGMLYAVQVLVESRRADQPNETTHPRAPRALGHETVLTAILAYHQQHEDRLPVQRKSVMAASLAKGAAGTSYDLQNTIVTGTLRGYWVSFVDFSSTTAVRQVLGVRSYRIDTGHIFPMSQRTRNVLPMVLDPQTNAASAGTPITSAVRLETLPFPLVRTNGEHTAVTVRSGGLSVGANLNIGTF
jgi:hypothetical protein